MNSQTLSLIPHFSGVFVGALDANCFSSFVRGVETVKTVGLVVAFRFTPLKWGVNKSYAPPCHLFVKYPGETVRPSAPLRTTPLRRGVNEKSEDAKNFVGSDTVKLFIAGVALGFAALGILGCSQNESQKRASVDVFVSGEVANPLPRDGIASTNWLAKEMEFVESDQVLGPVVEEFKLTERWSIPKAVAIERLQSRMTAYPLRGASPRPQLVETTPGDKDALGFSLSVASEDGTDSEELVEAIARSYKSEAEEVAAKQIAERLASAETESQQTQGKFDALKSELQQLQTNFFVPSRYKISKEFEAEIQARTRDAAKEETERRNQVESLRKMESEELRAALLKIELARLALPEVRASESASISVLVNMNQAQRAAEKELEMAKSGMLNETNAVAHAQLKLEQANRNLADSMDSYLKSLDIEYAVAKGRHQELETQLEKLRETSRLSDRKAALQKEIDALNSRLTSLGAEVDRLKLCQRIVTETIRIGQARRERVR